MQGRKHWIMFPPDTPKEVYKCRTDHEASTWFSQVYPTLDSSKHPYVEIVQEAGEVVYVPGGWAHVVMNLGTVI
jgi:histone arginine demethylase JMJD6